MLVLALLPLSAPVVACLSSGALTAQEQECCRKMPEGCEDMEMPSTHSCCTSGTVEQQGNPYLATARASVAPVVSPVHGQPAALALISAPLAASGVSHDGLYSNTHDPPESPPATISILRI